MEESPPALAIICEDRRRPNYSHSSAVLSPGGEYPLGYPTRWSTSVPVLARLEVRARTLALESF